MLPIFHLIKRDHTLKPVMTQTNAYIPYATYEAV